MHRLSCLLLSMLAIGPGDPPQSAGLLGFDQLKARLNDPRLRILDARPREAYDKGHIPGAIWVDEAAAQKLASKANGLTDRQAWAAWIAPLSLAPDTEVIVYDSNRQLSAARIWWLLSYLGVSRVGLLDGSFAAWEKQELPVSRETVVVDPKPFTIAFRPERSATREQVRSVVKDEHAQVLDARSREEYTGADAKSKRGGHIPSACHLEWKAVVDENGRFLDEAVLRVKLANAGIKPGSNVISHCQGGGRASVNAFVLERLGYKARNYYLGWSDWGNADDTPVEK